MVSDCFVVFAEVLGFAWFDVNVFCFAVGLSRATVFYIVFQWFPWFGFWFGVLV